MFLVFSWFCVIDSILDPLEIYFMNAECLYFTPATAVTTKSRSFQTRTVLLGFGPSPILVIYTNMEMIQHYSPPIHLYVISKRS